MCSGVAVFAEVPATGVIPGSSATHGELFPTADAVEVLL